MTKLNYTELLEHREKYLALERNWQKEQRKLHDLPSKLGFKSVDELIAALRIAALSVEHNDHPDLLSTIRRKRQKITPEITAMVKKLLEKGKTGAYIAKQVNVSLPSVHNIKKKLGMVSHRAL